MNPAPRQPYSGLGPLREALRIGFGLLTYHKLGPRPPGVRIRGLYVSQTLFERQLTELATAGFKSAFPAAEVAPDPSRPCVGITFDDGFHSALRHGLEPLARAGFRAIQFLVADRLGRTNDWDLPSGEVMEPLMTPAGVRAWLAAGHEIGAHTLTHPWLTRIPMARAREEIFASRRRLEDMFDRPVVHFCYPYGDHNEAVRDLVAEAGYTTACTTCTGINQPGQDRLGLLRLTARYRSRSLQSVVEWWHSLLQPTVR